MKLEWLCVWREREWDICAGIEGGAQRAVCGRGFTRREAFKVGIDAAAVRQGVFFIQRFSY